MLKLVVIMIDNKNFFLVSSLQAEEEDKFKKSNSLESLSKIINPNRIEKCEI